MGHCFSHLTKTDRYKIEALLNNGHSAKDISVELHVHVSTVYREVKRARWVRRNTDWTEVELYNPDEADRRYRDNLRAKGAPLKIGRDFELAEYLELKMLDKDNPHSPAAALADIALEGRHFKTTISLGTLYSYIAKGVFLTLTNQNLPMKPKLKRHYRKVQTLAKPPRGVSIEKRPCEIDAREIFGYWEMDTVYSKKNAAKSAWLVLTERKSRKEIIEPMPDRTAASTVRALDRIERRFGALFCKVFKSITVDNGSEFSDVAGLERSVLHSGKRTRFFFCHPYSSFERGSNENQNKMIRRRFPKGTDLAAVSPAAVKKLEDWINTYPRKILNWKTSEMVYQECLAMLD